MVGDAQKERRTESRPPPSPGSLRNAAEDVQGYPAHLAVPDVKELDLVLGDDRPHVVPGDELGYVEGRIIQGDHPGEPLHDLGIVDVQVGDGAVEQPAPLLGDGEGDGVVLSFSVVPLQGVVAHVRALPGPDQVGEVRPGDGRGREEEGQYSKDPDILHGGLWGRISLEFFPLAPEGRERTNPSFWSAGKKGTLRPVGG